MALNTLRWHKPKWLPRLLAMPVSDPSQHAARILSIQRNIVLPAKLVFTALIFFYLFPQGLNFATPATRPAVSPQEVFIETLQGFFIFYIIFNAMAATALVLRRFPTKLVPWVVFTVGLVDGLLLAGLTAQTGGFGSNFYWVFPGLILINALSIPLATPQIILNLLLSAFYLGAGVLNSSLGGGDLAPSETDYVPAQTKSERLAALKFSAADIVNLESFATKLKSPADPAGVSEYVSEQLSPATRGLLSNYTGGTDPALQKALQQDLRQLVQDGLEPLATRLKQPVGSETVSRFLADHLSPATLGLLTNYTGGADPALQKALVEDLNRVVQGGLIYSPRRFTNVPLSLESSNLIKDIARTVNPARLNHALLLDAFPDDLVRPHKTKTGFMEKNGSLPVGEKTDAEPFILRLIILWLMTGSCYGVQLLSFRQRLTEEEVRKSTARNDELKAAGRLAAEIAHQLKNPLGIINNAVFTLRRGLKDTKSDLNLQMDIIREEIERSDHILTQLMGYAQLSEGRVEKLNLAEELDRAIADVLPPGATYEIQIQRKYSANLPSLVMQRSHLTVVLVNLIQNAREALKGRGAITVQAHCPNEFSLEIIVADDGPGIAPENIDKVFEAYFTNKEKGTGLGLAIVRHNVELYGGAVWVESGLGKGARFVISFPAKAFIHSAS